MTDLSDPADRRSWPWPGARTRPRRKCLDRSRRSNASRCGPTGWTWGRPTRRLRRAAEAQPRRDRPVPRGQEVQRGGRCPAKKLTREYKAKLTKAERKAFRSLMWEFRRDPASLTAEERQALEGLSSSSRLKGLYRVRLGSRRSSTRPATGPQRHDG